MRLESTYEQTPEKFLNLTQAQKLPRLVQKSPKQLQNQIKIKSKNRRKHIQVDYDDDNEEMEEEEKEGEEKEEEEEAEEEVEEEEEEDEKVQGTYKVGKIFFHKPQDIFTSISFVCFFHRLALTSSSSFSSVTFFYTIQCKLNTQNKMIEAFTVTETC